MTDDRADGRSASTLRTLSCELSTLQNADGSALWKSGSTQVLASVHGPLAPRLTQHEETRGLVSVTFKSGTVGNTLEREWEDLLRRVLSACIILQEYPRCIIQVVVHILTADGSVLAAALHSTVSALMDAGIVMKFLPLAITCLLSTDGSIQLDPSASEERTDGAATIVIISDSQDKILGCHSTGLSHSMDTILQCCAVAERASSALTAFWRLVIEQKATREAKTLWSS